VSEIVMSQHAVDPLDGSPPVAVAERVTRELARVAASTPHAPLVIGAGRRARRRALPEQLQGPLVVVGPHCEADTDRSREGTYVVALDGSIGDEGVIPVVAAWTIEFGGTPWLVDVVARWTRPAPDVVESAYVNHRALRMRRRIGRDVEHETLHGDRPARAIVEFADDTAASLIFVGTDADSRRARRRRRSVAAEIIRRAACPVVLLRLPEVKQAPRPPRRPAPAPLPPVWSRAWCEQYGPDAVRLRRSRAGTHPTPRR
jgi:nucleotide-binding universal stress UspA family protein